MRTYLFIALITLGIAVLIGLVNGDGALEVALADIRTETIAAGISSQIANFIFNPLIDLLRNPYGAIIAALLWPLVLVDTALMFIMFLVSQVGLALDGVV